MLPFIFIAGVQPRTRVLDAQPRRCPRCGLQRAARKRVDHYLSLFFIPLLRVKKGQPFLDCEGCGPVDAEEAAPAGPGPATGKGVCRWCGRPVAADFRFCPYCGRPHPGGR